MGVINRCLASQAQLNRFIDRERIVNQRNVVDVAQRVSLLYRPRRLLIDQMRQFDGSADNVAQSFLKGLRTVLERSDPVCEDFLKTRCPPAFL